MSSENKPEQRDEPTDWEIFGLDQEAATLDELHVAYQREAGKRHTDGGGSDASFIKLHEAYERAKEAIGRRVPSEVAKKYEDAQKPDSDKPGPEVDVNR